MVSQDLEAVIHAEGEHVAVVGRHRVVIAAVGTVRVGILGRKGQGIRQQKLDTGGSIESQVGRVTVADGTRTRIIAGNQVCSAGRSSGGLIRIPRRDRFLFRSSRHT